MQYLCNSKILQSGADQELVLSDIYFRFVLPKDVAMSDFYLVLLPLLSIVFPTVGLNFSYIVVIDNLVCKLPGENIVAFSSIRWTPNSFMIAIASTGSKVIGGNLGCPSQKIMKLRRQDDRWFGVVLFRRLCMVASMQVDG